MDGEPQTLVCRHCGREFTAPSRRRPGPVPRYCGRSCRQRAYELRRDAPRSAELLARVRMLERVNRRLLAELHALGWTPDSH
jgi:hypothetical protein